LHHTEKHSSIFSSFEPVLQTIASRSRLDLRTGVEQLFDYFIVQNRQAVQSMIRRSMVWALEDNMVHGLFLFFCVTLTGPSVELIFARVLHFNRKNVILIPPLTND